MFVSQVPYDASPYQPWGAGPWSGGHGMDPAAGAKHGRRSQQQPLAAAATNGAVAAIGRVNEMLAGFEAPHSSTAYTPAVSAGHAWAGAQQQYGYQHHYQEPPTAQRQGGPSPLQWHLKAPSSGGGGGAAPAQGRRSASSPAATGAPLLGSSSISSSSPSGATAWSTLQHAPTRNLRSTPQPTTTTTRVPITPSGYPLSQASATAAAAAAAGQQPLAYHHPQQPHYATPADARGVDKAAAAPERCLGGAAAAAFLQGDQPARPLPILQWHTRGATPAAGSPGGSSSSSPAGPPATCAASAAGSSNGSGSARRRASAQEQHAALWAAQGSLGGPPAHTGSRWPGAGAPAAAPPPPQAAAAAAAAAEPRVQSPQLQDNLSRLKARANARLASRMTTPPSDNSSLGAVRPPNAGPATAPAAAGSGAMPSAAAAAAAAAATRPRARGGGAGAPTSPAIPSSSNSSSSSSRQQESSTLGSWFKAAARLSSSFQRRADSAAPGLPPDAMGPPAAPLVPCSSCGRTFTREALQRHESICARVFCQKRKAYNAAAHRSAQGQGSGRPRSSAPASAAGWPGAQPHPSRTAAAAAAATAGPAGRARAGRGTSSRDDQPVGRHADKMPRWQQQSLQLRAAMRAQRNISAAVARGEDIRSLPMDPALDVPDERVPCPHCGRRYATDVAERHIPKCAGIMAKPSELRAGGGKSAFMRVPGSRR